MCTSEYGDGGGLASSIVTQESSDLSLIHVQIQTIHCNHSLGLTISRALAALQQLFLEEHTVDQVHKSNTNDCEAGRLSGCSLNGRVYPKFSVHIAFCN